MSSDGHDLVDELTQLAQNELSLEEFYGQMLPRLTRHLNAEGTAVWLCQGEEIKPFCRHGIDPAAGNGHGELDRHQPLLEKVRSAGQPAYVLPKSADSSSRWANPTEYLLSVCPVKVDDAVVALMASYHDQEARGAETAESGLRPLRAAAGIAGRFHHNAELRELRQRSDWWSKFEAFSETVHGSLSPRKTAYAIANEARLLIGCDRVSVLIRRGARFRVEAISGQDAMNRRANTVVLLQDMVAATTVLGEPFRYPVESAEELPPQVEAVLEPYVDNSHCHELLVYPLAAGTTPSDGATLDPNKVIGALVVEQFSANPIPRELVAPVSRQSGSALGNALEHHQVFLLPLWKAIGKLGLLVSAKNLPKTIAAALTILVIVAALVFIPADFELTAEGTLQPEQRRHVFSQTEGVIDDLFVRHGSQVEAGEDLAKLRSSEIDLKLLEIQGELDTTGKKLAAAKAARVALTSSAPGDHQAINKLAADEEELRRWVASLENQQQLLLDRREMLVVQSPLDGEVITWDLENLLTARPVERGAVLMTVAKTDGPWVLELLLPDKSVGHLRTAQEASDSPLQVAFILATNPNVRLEGTVTKVGLSTITDENLGLCLPVTVELEESKIPQLRPGAKVFARIHCGKRALGYVWLHQVMEFFQTHVLFRFS